MAIMTASALAGAATVTTWPAPPDLATSPDFAVTVNKTPVWVEKISSAADTSVPADFLPQGLEMEALNTAWFACAGPMTITITASANITSHVVRPKSRGIKAQVKGRDLTFTIPGPQKLYVEINNLPHLAIFADVPEVSPPKAGDPGVVFYGPGTHSPGTIELQSNQTVYIAGGAVVNANVRGKDLENVKIMGRGVLNGNVRISNTVNLEVSGIFIRNKARWTNTLGNCRHSAYRNVKVFGHQAIFSVDGINPVSCRDFIIDDCFIRTRDDCVAIKSMDRALNVDSITVSNCVLVGWMCADGVTLGFELNGSPVQNVLVKNCDILYTRGGGQTGGHAGFSIVCDGPALVQNIRFEDIRIEEQVYNKNLELIVTDGTLYGKGPAGHIKGVHLKNVSWENAGRPFIISGYAAENPVEDITFEHCTIGGKALTGAGDADFKVNEFVKNVKFLP